MCVCMTCDGMVSACVPTLGSSCRLTLRQKVTGALQIASALVHAHSKKIVHQDIHRGNILRTRDETAWELADFGNSGREGDIVPSDKTM